MNPSNKAKEVLNKDILGAFHQSITLAKKCLNLKDSTMDVVRLFFEVSAICLDKKDLSKISIEMEVMLMNMTQFSQASLCSIIVISSSFLRENIDMNASAA